MLVEQCALMRMFFRNDQGVRLLEHVRLLERIRYLQLERAGNVVRAWYELLGLCEDVART